MLIGIDFDNTIVCYDELFRKVAVERGLVPQNTPANKTAVRDHLRRMGKEDLWTELQGHVYAARMLEAAAYPGAIEFFMRCHRDGIPVRIISHRSRYPYRGEQHDLHQAARNWLVANGFHDPARIGMLAENVYFELTKSDKLARVASTGVTHFIDDLPELLDDPAFPGNVQKLLFDPSGSHIGTFHGTRAAGWDAIPTLLKLR